jgi:uncharacterized protein DUF4274
MTSETIESRSWELVRAYLAEATPAEWHLFAARSNYDANATALRWLIDQKALDRATALLIYWNLGAAWFVQFLSAQESSNPDTFQLLRLIEDRYHAGFYEAGNIWFDPRASDGGRPDNYPDVEVRRPVPGAMLEPVNGDEYVEVASDPEGFDEGLPVSVVDALYALQGGAA